MYNHLMIITIEVINQGSLKLLRGMESLGLIHIKTSASQVKKTYRSFRGYCKNSPNGSVDEFLARCQAEKEQELAIEKRNEEKRSGHV